MNRTAAFLFATTLFAATPFPGKSQAEAQGEQQAITIARSGSRSSTQGSPEWFTGSVHVEALFSAKAPGRTSAGSVTFQPGARTAWHIHPAGQALIVTAGNGWVQSWGGPRQEIRAGDMVQFPAGVKHWHGATTTSPMAHIAVQEAVEGKNVEWLEKVAEDQYSGSKGYAASAEPMAPSQQTTATSEARKPMVRIAELEIDPPQLENYLAALREEIEASIRLEPGVLTLYAVSLKDSPTSIRIFETYADRSAYESHIATPHFVKYKVGTEKMVKSLRLIETDPVLLGAKQGGK